MKFSRTLVGLTAAALCAIASYGTDVSGIIDSDTRWTSTENPYLVTGDIVVTRNARLAIGPGTEIRVAALKFVDEKIPQIDHLDEQTIKIKIEGTLICEGKSDKRIVFAPAAGRSTECGWYGIVLDKASDKFSEIAYLDIAGACNGITMTGCAITIRNCLFENNNVGLICSEAGNAKVYQSIFTANYTAGIQIKKSNPTIKNSIIAFNYQNGIWCDGISQIDSRYNCIFGNTDVNIAGCDPRIGLRVKKNNNKDSTDVFGTITLDPVFSGSGADSVAVERDISRPTKKSLVGDTTLARMVPQNDTLAQKPPAGTNRRGRFTLSKYSPCRNSGDPLITYKDRDGSQSDMGIWGGPDIIK